MIRFTVDGIPKGQPRPRAFAFNGKARVYDAGTAEGWKSLVALSAKPHLPTQPIEGPILLDIEFFMPRPKSHFRKAGLKPDAPQFHTGKPDADNLVKAVMDVLTQLGVWRDDAQVGTLRVRKGFADRPGCAVMIAELDR